MPLFYCSGGLQAATVAAQAQAAPRHSAAQSSRQNSFFNIAVTSNQSIIREMF